MSSLLTNLKSRQILTFLILPEESNCGTEMSGKLESAVFKQLVSGEPVEARLPYGEPFTLTEYAKLIFNCNELPKDVEHTNGYFRRFLIIPFDVTIPPHEQDKQLHTKIIERELSGVFNWVLEGLNRLLDQKGFTDCQAAQKAVEQYRTEADSVRMFMEEFGYIKSPTKYKLSKDLYSQYRIFCQEDGYSPLKRGNFTKRLDAIGIVMSRLNIGNVAYIENGREGF